MVRSRIRTVFQPGSRGSIDRVPRCRAVRDDGVRGSRGLDLEIYSFRERMINDLVNQQVFGLLYIYIYSTIVRSFFSQGQLDSPVAPFYLASPPLRQVHHLQAPRDGQHLQHRGPPPHRSGDRLRLLRPTVVPRNAGGRTAPVLPVLKAEAG